MHFPNLYCEVTYISNINLLSSIATRGRLHLLFKKLNVTYRSVQSINVLFLFSIHNFDLEINSTLPLEVVLLTVPTMPNYRTWEYMGSDTGN